MAAFQENLEQIEGSGAPLVGLSVDREAVTEEFRAELGLTFTILCDTDRQVVRTWDRFNKFEMGGIAKPTLFVIDREMRVRLRVDGRADSRYGVDELVSFLGSGRRIADLQRALPHSVLMRALTLVRLVKPYVTAEKK